MTNYQLIVEARSKGIKISHVIATATALHNGWEMDNDIWLVVVKGNKVLLSTDHGGVCLYTSEELTAKIEETKRSYEQLLQLKALQG